MKRVYRSALRTTAKVAAIIFVPGVMTAYLFNLGYKGSRIVINRFREKESELVRKINIQ